jgi:hypothetical protein
MRTQVRGAMLSMRLFGQVGRRSRRLAAAQLLLVCLPWRAWSAEPLGTEVALAEALYRQARGLMSQGKYDEACPKLAESYRLDRATGTLLNLAACHEHQGKVATTWLEYSDSLLAARRDGRPDRVRFAQDRIAALEPQLSRLTVTVSEEADMPELEIRLDGALIGLASRDVATPVDPGQHQVEAMAPGKVAWSREIEVGRVADQQTVMIPTLVDATRARTAALNGERTPAPPVRPDPPTVGDEPATSRPLPDSVYIAGAATAALGVAAGITGILYLQERSDIRTPDDYHAARALGVSNGVLWAATLGAAGATAYFYFTRPERPATDRVNVRLSPYAALQGAGLFISGGF